MDITIVIGQMCVMLIIILLGYFMFKKQKVSDLSSRQISGLVVNICNPATLICSAFEPGPKASAVQLLTAFWVTVLLYAVLWLTGILIALIMKVPKEERYQYHFLTMYGNVGFLGIPLVSSVLGSSSLIYVSINCLVFNLLFYITAIPVIQKKAAGKETPHSGQKAAFPLNRKGFRDIFQKLINAGTVSAVLTIFFYLGNFDVPMVIADTITYAGRATTFLSMFVLGVSIAQMPLKEIFSHKRDYLFVLLRMLVLPILCVLVMKQFIADPLILGSSALLISVPCANLPLMCSREHGLNGDTLARTIILTTLLSVITIPIVVMFL